MTDKEVTVKLTKSLIGSKDFQKNSVRGLGLFKLGQTVSVKDTPENRGMINKAIHLLEVN
ncbi:50S ribosomal protein L30 [Gammaproteobacteria bacterium]|jgi:large subunit ribosomal protein L30|nr:50S ribosomal protein L30 [Gammaproteobacteria bacterium]MDG1119413.1 50S ribosomal protein L30 [SAR86 cluster bacterium]MDG1230182.1 50S ribosomal protein L30 [SAR86 cluster bacterium]MDG1680787.1 50S ribosomal protein L30 [SAR86 cluster bacterium]|tara:strand:- start:722 stop:901 length:180 start_codon:yes stop_codon:yes gene_type:complete